jgi:hypothetical protein
LQVPWSFLPLPLKQHLPSRIPNPCLVLQRLKSRKTEANTSAQRQRLRLATRASWKPASDSICIRAPQSKHIRLLRGGVSSVPTSDSGFRYPLSIGILHVQSQDRSALSAKIGKDRLRTGDNYCRSVFQTSCPDFNSLRHGDVLGNIATATCQALTRNGNSHVLPPGVNGMHNMMSHIPPTL